MKDQLEKVRYALISLSDNCPSAYLIRYDIPPSVNYLNNVKKVCQEIITILDTIAQGKTPVKETT